MSVNKFRIRVGNLDKQIVIPISTDFDESLGREQGIKMYERTEIQDNINPVQDFETTRYSPNTQNPNKRIYYDMYFTNLSEPNGNENGYSNDYSVVGISYPDVKNRKQTFTKSFFKFDFYDQPSVSGQRLYFSVVLPANNGNKVNREISNDENDINYDPISYLTSQANSETQPFTYEIESSSFEFASVGNRKENYYIQWLKDDFLVPITTFYMGCKFFNALTGEIIKLINKPQPENTFKLKPEDFFYYRLVFNRNNYTYEIFEYNTISQNLPEVGETGGNSIKFYQYINP